MNMSNVEAVEDWHFSITDGDGEVLELDILKGTATIYEDGFREMGWRCMDLRARDLRMLAAWLPDAIKYAEEREREVDEDDAEAEA